MERTRELNFRQLLSDAKFDSDTLEMFVSDEQSAPVYQMSVFMKHVWDPVMRKHATGWIRSTIDFLEDNSGRTDLYALRFLPERTELLSALKNTLASGVNESDVTTIVREAQLAVMEHIISMIDGGISLEEGEDEWSMYELRSTTDELMANRMTQEEADRYADLHPELDDLAPTRPFFDMKEYVWLFDPDRED